MMKTIKNYYIEDAPKCFNFQRNIDTTSYYSVPDVKTLFLVKCVFGYRLRDWEKFALRICRVNLKEYYFW